jgi:hypothetical protein
VTAPRVWVHRGAPRTCICRSIMFILPQSSPRTTTFAAQQHHSSIPAAAVVRLRAAATSNALYKVPCSWSHGQTDLGGQAHTSPTRAGAARRHKGGQRHKRNKTGVTVNRAHNAPTILAAAEGAVGFHSIRAACRWGPQAAVGGLRGSRDTAPIIFVPPTICAALHAGRQNAHNGAPKFSTFNTNRRGR